MNKTAKKITAFALAVAFMITIVLAAACSCKRYKLDTFDYNAIEYQRPNYTALDRAFEKANKNVNGSAMTLVDALNDVSERLNEMSFMFSYLSIEYNKDTVRWRDDYLTLSAKYNEAFQKYYDLIYNILESDNSSLLNGWSEEDKEFIRSRHEVMSDEYVMLSNEIDGLIAEYNALQGEESAYAIAAAEILIELVAKNNELAVLEGYENYVDYAYESYYERDYTVEQVEELCESFKTYLSPKLGEYADAGDGGTGQFFGISANDLDTGKALVREYATEIGNYMTEAYDYMEECNLHYTATLSGNPYGYTGAFTTWLYGYEAPYMYQMCTGGYGDISTFVHEFGHFTAYYNLGNTGAGTLDINEIQSQANEALFMPYYKKMYSEASAAKIEKQELFKSIFWSVLMGCLFDEFQRELYLKPQIYNTPQSVNALFDRLIAEYNATAYIPRPQLRYWWAEVPHTFQSPFYYISYAVSQLPALIIYEDSISDRSAAIAEYNYIQNYGDGTYTFNTLLEKAGVKSPFEKETISSLATFLDSRLLAA